MGTKEYCKPSTWLAYCRGCYRRVARPRKAANVKDFSDECRGNDLKHYVYKDGWRGIAEVNGHLYK